MRTRIQNATIVNEGKRFVGTVTLEDDKILSIVPSDDTIHTLPPTDRVIDAEGLYLIPGVIDDHVHFREPGLTHKADIATESRAAAAGGVTSYMDMPNVVPQTTTLEALDDKFRLAAEKSLVNYSFFFGATHTNTGILEQLDPHKVCGVKLFMGSSTGNMLVDREDALRAIFSRSPPAHHDPLRRLVHHIGQPEIVPGTVWRRPGREIPPCHPQRRSLFPFYGTGRQTGTGNRCATPCGPCQHRT